MRQVCAPFIVALGVAGANALVHADAVDVQARLLAEPLWLLQERDGTNRRVWFELRGGDLRLVSCSGSPECWRAATVAGQRVRVDGFTEVLMVWPDSAGASPVLVPAWVVPSTGLRIGH